MDHGAGRDFILKYKSTIKQQLGNAVLREFILNYRTHNRTSSKTKLLNDFRLFILPKTEHHVSDLAIAYNIIKNFHLDVKEQSELIDFMYNRIQSSLHADVNSSLILKKYFVLAEVSKMLDERKTLRSEPRQLDAPAHKTQ